MRNIISQHRAEVSASVSLIMAGLSIIGIIYTLDAVDVRAAKAWENLVWNATACTVAGFGVAYRGDCDMNTTVEMAVGEFHECPGRHLHLGTGWNSDTAKVCRDAGKDAYAKSRNEALHVGRSLQGGIVIFNPPNFYAPDIRCQNGYLFWLNVALNLTDSRGDVWLNHRCAYEYGAEQPSIMGKWHDVRTMKSRFESMVGSAHPAKCWRLGSDDCVVAFHDPAEFTAQEALQRLFSKAMAVICAALSLLTSFSACFFAYADDRFTAYSPLPGEETDPIEQRVGDILRSAAETSEAGHFAFRRASGAVIRFASGSGEEDCVVGEINDAFATATKRTIRGLDPAANIAMTLLVEAEAPGDERNTDAL